LYGLEVLVSREYIIWKRIGIPNTAKVKIFNRITVFFTFVEYNPNATYSNGNITVFLLNNNLPQLMRTNNTTKCISRHNTDEFI
jgi:hypothetical protein